MAHLLEKKVGGPLRRMSLRQRRSQTVSDEDETARDNDEDSNCRNVGFKVRGPRNDARYSARAQGYCKKSGIPAEQQGSGYDRQDEMYEAETARTLAYA
jgi:hypothetical protein